jgi:hypothetical protein
MKFIGLFMLTVLSLSSSAQELISQTIDINPVYSSRDTTALIEIKIKVKFDPSDITETIDLETDSINFSAKINLLTKTLSFPKVKNSSGGPYEKSILILLKGVKNPLVGDELMRLHLSSDSKKLHPVYIRMTERGLYSPNKPFWIEVGSNFDLIDGLQPNNFFSGVFLHKKDIRPFSFRIKHSEKASKSKNLGIFAGVYESKTISIAANDGLGVKEYFNAKSLNLKQGDSVGLFRDSARVKTSQVVRNLGLFLSPQVRLSRGSADADGLHFFASLWIELQWQRAQLVKEYSNLSRFDTAYIPNSQLFKYETESGNNVSVTNTLDFRSHYYGMGLPILFRDGNTNVFINSVIGITNQPRVTVNTNEFKDTQRSSSWGWFYAIQFRLNEEKYGISFTGEVRGLTINNSPPYVSLALSKKFDLTKFLEFK